MVPVMSLWLPILIAAILVFVASSIIHMVLPYHKNDFKKLPDEDGVMAALQPFTIPPGDYCVPHAESNEAMKAPEYNEKLNKGPVAFMTVMPNGQWKMGPSLVQWFLFSILVGVTAAYIAGRALEPGAEYFEVFRFAGATAFYGYALALIPGSIWYKRSWSSTFKSVFDGFIYGMLTAGAFAGFWPA